jgi:hypothetical protein
LLGLVGVVGICALTPYNDYVLNNTFLVGNNLPLGLMLATLAFVVLINGPLSRWAPRRALGGGEMAVAFSMILVGCALPSSGLMRYLPGSILGPFDQARSRSQYRALLEALHLPDWIWPTFAGTTVNERMNDPVVTGYVGRWIGDGAPPYAAWVPPVLAWGLFVFALFGALLCLVVLVRRQWNENERLPFPLAQIQLALIEPPAPGRWLNATLSRRGLWIAFALVLFVRTWNGCAVYWPRAFPEVPMGYDFLALTAQRPLSYASYNVRVSTIYLAVVGVTFFLSTPVAFSLWFFFVLDQFYKMFLGAAGGDPKRPGAWDEHFGGVIAFALVIAWIGRDHWRLVLAQAVRGARPGEPRGKYLSHRAAFWGLLTCAGGMVAWLVAAGASVIGAAVTVGLLLLLFLVITRIIAETGLVYGQLLVPLYKPWQLLAHYGWARPVSLETFYLSGMLQNQHYDMREPMPVYASHALKLNDEVTLDRRQYGGADDDRRARRTGRLVLAAMAVALLVAYPVSFASVLLCEYHYASTVDERGLTPINENGLTEKPDRYLLKPTLDYQRGTTYVPHEPLAHIAGGFVVTAALAFLRFKFAWWPLHPIGFLMVSTTPIEMMWFSIFLGWLCKALIVKFGGASLFLRARPFFLGIILGECAAAGLWLIVGIVLSTMGVTYRAVNIMPN